MKTRTINTLLRLARNAARAKGALRLVPECDVVVAQIDTLDAVITSVLARHERGESGGQP